MPFIMPLYVTTVTKNNITDNPSVIIVAPISRPNMTGKQNSLVQKAFKLHNSYMLHAQYATKPLNR